MQTHDSVERKVAICIVHYRTPSLLLDAVNSIMAGKDRDSSVIWIWDNSVDSEISESLRTDLERDSRGINFVVSEANIGFGAACNALVRFATQDVGITHIVFLNPDAKFVKGSASDLSRELDAKNAGLISAQIVGEDGAPEFMGGALATRSGRVFHYVERQATVAAHSIPFATGACLAVSTEVFRELGGFDESFFLYWEDVDLSFRAVSAGLSIEVSELVVASHLVSASGRDLHGPRRSNAFYYNTAHYRKVFYSKHRRTLPRSWRWYTPLWAVEVMARAIVKQGAGVSEVLATVRGLR